MSKTQNNLTESELEMVFDAARQAAPAPTDAFMESVLADALSAMPPAPALPRGRMEKRPWYRLALDAIGGFKGVGALTACLLASVWIGYSAPDDIGMFTGSIIALNDTGSGDFYQFTSLDDLFLEG